MRPDQFDPEPRKYFLQDGSVVTDDDFAEGDIVPWLLTEEEDAQRLQNLKVGTGRASWWEYPLFRGLVLLIGRLLVKRVIINTDKIPGGLGFYPKPYFRRARSFLGRVKNIIIAPTHADERDILITGSFRRPLVWTCKPWFTSGPMWLAKLCLYNGALPIFRTQIDGKYSVGKRNPKKDNNLAMIHHHQMRSYKGSEALEIVERRLNEGFSAEFFIEGTRLGASKVSSGFFGAIKTSRRTAVPLLPIAIVGVSEDDPIIRPGLAKWRRVVLAVVCDPIDPRDFEHLPGEEGDRAMMATWTESVNEGREMGRAMIMHHGKIVGTVKRRRKE